MLTLVTGGARSGKSRHAEALIADAPQVLYIATSQIFDDEMAARIQHHRDGRPAHWRTAERWQQLDELITPAIAPAEAILLECITTMVTIMARRRRNNCSSMPASNGRPTPPCARP